jgi:hypothetical protein
VDDPYVVMGALSFYLDVYERTPLMQPRIEGSLSKLLDDEMLDQRSAAAMIERILSQYHHIDIMSAAGRWSLRHGYQIVQRPFAK